MTEVAVRPTASSAPKIPRGIGKLVHNCEGVLLDHSHVYCSRFPRNRITLYQHALEDLPQVPLGPGTQLQFDFGYFPDGDTFLAVNIRPLSVEPVPYCVVENRHWLSVPLESTSFGGFYKNSLLGLVADPLNVLTPYSLNARPLQMCAFVEFVGHHASPAKFCVVSPYAVPAFATPLRSIGFVLNEQKEVLVSELAHLKVVLPADSPFEVGQWLKIEKLQWLDHSTVMAIEASASTLLGKLQTTHLADGLAFRTVLKTYSAQEKIVYNEDIGLVENATAVEPEQRYTYMWVVDNRNSTNGIRLRAIATELSELTPSASVQR